MDCTGWASGQFTGNYSALGDCFKTKAQSFQMLNAEFRMMNVTKRGYRHFSFVFGKSFCILHSEFSITETIQANEIVNSPRTELL